MDIIWYLIKYTIFLPWVLWVVFITLLIEGWLGQLLGHGTAAILYFIIVIKLFNNSGGRAYGNNYESDYYDYEPDCYDYEPDDYEESKSSSYRGYCSHHGGIYDVCDSGTIICNDGSVSPSS